MLRYYRETESGDYLCADHSTRDYYARIGKPEQREARATAIEGSRRSICTASVDVGWLRESCKPVLKREIPLEWLDAMVGPE